LTAGQQFPDGFLWGAATSAHQVEGNNVNSDWWAREYAAGSGLHEPSGDACDSYHNYPDDIDLLANAGLNTYRFSLEWSRIESERGYVSRAQIDHYRRMVAACHGAGLTPVVTLHHFTLPRWTAELGGWRHPDTPELFARYTEAALEVVAEGVQWVCTINEPNMLAKVAGEQDCGPHEASAQAPPNQYVADALAQAHRHSRDVLSSLSGIKSGWTVATQAFQAEPGCEEAADAYGYPREGFFLEVARDDDFVGVQAYTRTIIGPNGPQMPPAGAETTLTGWEYFPAALGIGVRNAWNLAGRIPILVTENGIATDDDTRRIAYMQAVLLDLHDAMAEGVDVRGYIHWSALDNYEWGSYDPTFGLIAVDRTTFARTPKPSLGWLGNVAQARSTTISAAERKRYGHRFTPRDHRSRRA